MIEDLILRGDYDRALDHLIILEFNSSLLDERINAAFISARLYEQSLKIETSIRLLQRFYDREVKKLNQNQTNLIRYEQARLFLLINQKKEAALLLDFDSAKKTAISALDNEHYFPKFYENPIFQAFCSTLLPGSGQVLQGKPQDAITALFMIGLPYYFFHRAKKNDEHIFASAAGVIAGFFYLGNIASTYRIGARVIEKRNDELRLQIINREFKPAVFEAAEKLEFSIDVSKKLE